MQRGASFSNTDKTLTVRVPLTFRRRGGRRRILAPEGLVAVSRRGPIDMSLIKAMARAFRWQRLMESGACTSIEDVAAADAINASYVGRMLRLALLDPNIIQAILDGRQGSEVTLARLMRPFPAEWDRQRETLKLSGPQFDRSTPSRNDNSPARPKA